MKKSTCSLLLLLLSAASAQDTGLYAPAPPANSAFVRVVNAPEATLGTKAVKGEAGKVSAYVVVPQGNVTAKIGSATANLKVEAGKFYTAGVSGGKVVLLTDQGADNRAKAVLTVYNLSKNASIDLKTADGKTTVITGVKPGSSGSRAVNGITVDLSAFAGPKVVGTVSGVKLERGSGYALVVSDTGMTVTQSSTKTN